MNKYGTDGKYLHRTSDPDTSIEAAYSVNTTYLEEMVHNAIKTFGNEGCISDDVRQKFPNYPYSSITARFSALDRKGLIKRTGEKRKGKSGRNQQVMFST